MDFRFSQKEEAFRQEVREFLEKELPPDWFWRGDLLMADLDTEETRQFRQGFIQKLVEKGWYTLSWPKEYGGQARSVSEDYVYCEEMKYRRAPGIGSPSLTIVGPLIMLHGTEEQKGYFLPRIARGEIEFSLGFSEPGAGSDLASLQLRATEEGDDFVFSGQKTFTSWAHLFDYCLLAARTEPKAPKHKGISLFLVDMKTPGITWRPLMDLRGLHVINQVYFDEVRIPRSCLLGEKNCGWYLLAVSLDLERAPQYYFIPIQGLKRLFEELIQYVKGEEGKGNPLAKDPQVRQRLAQIAIEIEVGRLLDYRVAWQLEKSLISNYEAAQSKLFRSELSYRLANTAMGLLGLHGQLRRGSKRAPLKGMIEHLYVNSVLSTVGSGTSEIQRNIIATRGLGLPRSY